MFGDEYQHASRRRPATASRASIDRALPTSDDARSASHGDPA
jgi:hypothetical protein